MSVCEIDLLLFFVIWKIYYKLFKCIILILRIVLKYVLVGKGIGMKVGINLCVFEVIIVIFFLLMSDFIILWYWEVSLYLVGRFVVRMWKR